MFIKENFKSTRSLKTKYIIFHEKFSSSDRKIDFYWTTGAVLSRVFRSPSLNSATPPQPFFFRKIGATSDNP